MAIYHLNTRIVSRGKGHSAVAAAAYRARTELVDERTGKKWDYSRKQDDVLFEGIYAPKDAPEWTRDRATLWNRAEQAERRCDAQVARQFIIGMPHELTLEQQRMALQDFVRENFMRKGYVADVAIHKPDVQGDERNTHAHVMVTMRVIDGEGFAVKKGRTEDRAAELEGWRLSWELTGNRFLKRFGHEPDLDRRSLEKQGIEREPGIHIGQRANRMERDGVATDRGEDLHNIRQKNEARDIYDRLKPHEAQSAVDRQRLEASAERIAEERQLDRGIGRGLGLPHHMREIMAAIRSLSRTMGEAIHQIVINPNSRRSEQRIEPSTPPAEASKPVHPSARETLSARLQRESKERVVDQPKASEPQPQPARRLEDELGKRRTGRRIEDELLL